MLEQELSGIVTFEWLKTGEGVMRNVKTAAVNMALIKQTIETVMKHLQNNMLSMPPATIADVVEVLYEERAESEATQVNKGSLARMIKLVS